MMSREMKDSGIEWLGKRPSDWKECRLKDVSSLYGGLTGKAGDDFNVEDGDNYALFIPFTNIFNNDIIQIDKLYKVKVEENEKQNEVHKGDLLFLMSSEDFDGIGKSALMNDEVPNLYLNSFCKGLKVISKDVNSIFLNYLMSSHITRELIRMEAKGFIRINLRQDKLLCCPLILPYLSEQQKIANQLDTKCAEIDNLISLQEKMIAELKAYKQSVITEAVCKGLDKNVPMKDSGVEWIGEIPEHWEIRKVTHIYENIGSGTTPKSSNESYYVDEGYSFLQTGDLNDGIIERTSKYLSEKALKECSLKTYPKGGLVIAMYGATIGKLGILNIDTVTNQACCVLSGNSVYDKMFSFYVFFADRPNLIMQANGGGQPNISQDIIKREKLPVPPLSEQQTIASYLDKKCANIDQLISIKQQKTVELKEYKKSMIYEYVTGKKEVI